jgi:hypothetical protein
MKSLANIAKAQRLNPRLKIVTVTTDPLAQGAQISARLAQLGVRSEPYAFSGAPQEALRYAIDPAWAGEKPRAYRYTSDGNRIPISGVVPIERFVAD